MLVLNMLHMVILRWTNTDSSTLDHCSCAEYSTVQRYTVVVKFHKDISKALNVSLFQLFLYDKAIQKAAHRFLVYCEI